MAGRTASAGQWHSLVRDNGPFLLVDGQQGFGHVIAEQAMEMAIDRARTSQIAVLSLRNSFHLGRLGDWGAMAAEAGFHLHHLRQCADRKAAWWPRLAAVTGGS
jgi:LDH2 family malate/lactate/ureidoglycolate dehydrogenase